MQQAVRDLLELTSELSERDFSVIEKAVPILDRLTLPISEEDVRGLISVLPADGDTTAELNWTVLHAIEASSAWPIWYLLADPEHEWVQIFLIRLRNAGVYPPAPN